MSITISKHVWSCNCYFRGPRPQIRKFGDGETEKGVVKDMQEWLNTKKETDSCINLKTYTSLNRLPLYIISYLITELNLIRHNYGPISTHLPSLGEYIKFISKMKAFRFAAVNKTNSICFSGHSSQSISIHFEWSWVVCLYFEIYSSEIDQYEVITLYTHCFHFVCK